jgi:hypothetical protein
MQRQIRSASASRFPKTLPLYIIKCSFVQGIVVLFAVASGNKIKSIIIIIKVAWYTAIVNEVNKIK